MIAPPGDDYDLVHVRARHWEGGRLRSASLLQLDFDFSGASLSLEEARAQRRALDRHGITALIVPARYRTAAISLTEAAMRAAKATRRARGGSRPQLPRLHAEHPMFFTFLIPTAQPETSTAGSAPGRLVSVDRCDGHIWDDREMGEYFELIGSR